MPQLVGAFPSPGQPGWVTFKWNKVQNADQYFIQLSHTQDFSFLFYSDSTTSDTSRTVAGFSEGLQYYWRVQAKNVEGSSPWSASNFTVDVKDVKEGKIPTEYSISQNYPNPFNPTTTISFGLPVKSYVSLKIFDYLGREIAIIVSEEMLAGSYSKQWNASNMSSGIYFYRLQAGTFTETKKLVLLR